eukprot:14054697-Ditylum_brightwellii.AAC.1
MIEHQCNGGQGQEAIDNLVLTIWQIKIFTLACHNVAFTGCDAKACYNRVVLVVSVLSQIQAGLPLHAAQFFLWEVKQLEYHMITSYRVSENGVTHSISQRIHGQGQGTIDASPNWTLISNVCQKAYEKHSKGCRILDPIGID